MIAVDGNVAPKFIFYQHEDVYTIKKKKSNKIFRNILDRCHCLK